MKRCPKCGRLLPANTVSFHKARYSKNGLSAYCRICTNRIQREKYDTNEHTLDDMRIAKGIYDNNGSYGIEPTPELQAKRESQVKAYIRKHARVTKKHQQTGGWFPQVRKKCTPLKNNGITSDFRDKVAKMRHKGTINEHIARELNCSPKRTRRAYLQWVKKGYPKIAQ